MDGAQWTIPDPVLPIDDVRARAAIGRLGGPVVALVGGAGDVEIPVPGSEWTFPEATVPCSPCSGPSARRSGASRRLGDARGRGAGPDDHGGGGPHDPPALARQLDRAVQTLLAAAGARAPDDVMGTPWYGRDTSHRVGAMTCLVLGEVALHGWDLAQAVGQPWPIEPEDARRIISGVFPGKAPVIADPETTEGVDLTYEVRVDGGPAFSFRVAGATGEIRPAGTWPADCILEGDPVAIVLWVYGRVATEERFAAGRVRASGVDPSLGPRFKAFVRNP